MQAIILDFASPTATWLNNWYISAIRKFPEMGVPPVIIHLKLRFPWKKTASFWGTIFGKPEMDFNGILGIAMNTPRWPRCSDGAQSRTWRKGMIQRDVDLPSHCPGENVDISLKRSMVNVYLLQTVTYLLVTRDLFFLSREDGYKSGKCGRTTWSECQGQHHVFLYLGFLG